jgi:predicted HicB family RNase H-like nuclease
MASFNENFAATSRARRGRPRRHQPTVKANVRLSVPVYDALCRLALAERVSLHAVLQRELTRAVVEHRHEARPPAHS